MLMCLAAALTVPEATAQIEMAQSVLASGGGSCAAGDHAMAATVGEAQIGITSGAGYVHGIGFWWLSNWIVTSVSGEEEARPLRFWLSHGYPNPFNPQTTIEYTVPAPAHVSLEIFDVAGRVVEALVDGVKDAGRHRATLRGDRLASGVYYCRMQSGEFTQVRRLVLVK
jgi:hypothetical protein